MLEPMDADVIAIDQCLLNTIYNHSNSFDPRNFLSWVKIRLVSANLGVSTSPDLSLACVIYGIKYE